MIKILIPYIASLEFYKWQEDIIEKFKLHLLYNSTKNYVISYDWHDGDNHNDDGSYEDYIIYQLWEIPD